MDAVDALVPAEATTCFLPRSWMDSLSHDIAHLSLMVFAKPGSCRLDLGGIQMILCSSIGWHKTRVSWARDELIIDVIATASMEVGAIPCSR